MAALLFTALEGMERFGSRGSDACETGPLRGHASCLIVRWSFGLGALGTESELAATDSSAAGAEQQIGVNLGCEPGAEASPPGESSEEETQEKQNPVPTEPVSLSEAGAAPSAPPPFASFRKGVS